MNAPHITNDQTTRYQINQCARPIERISFRKRRILTEHEGELNRDARKAILSLGQTRSTLTDLARRRPLMTTLERVKGIEPSYAAWEAAVLPLNYTRL